MDAQELEKLFELKEKGIITEEEFNQKKKDFFEQAKASNSNKRTILDNYLYCFQNSFNLSGRARRSEFWYFVLVNFIAIAIFITLTIIAAITTYTDISILGQIYNIITIVPTFSVVVRRFHDLDMDTVWGALYLIPAILSLVNPFFPLTSAFFIVIYLICGIILIIFMCTKGDEKENRFGMPK